MLVGGEIGRALAVRALRRVEGRHLGPDQARRAARGGLRRALQRGSPGHDGDDGRSLRYVDRDAIATWSRDTEWQGLEIVATEAGGETDDTGIVEFIARGSTNGRVFAQRERSRFRRVDGAWFYVDGKVGGEPARKVPTAGRNDPCPCGSGMKYKRCHGA